MTKVAEATGKDYEQMLSGDTAWIAYVNKGSSATLPVPPSRIGWNRHFFEKQAGNWKIVFMHSTRVQPPPKENQGK